MIDRERLLLTALVVLIYPAIYRRGNDARSNCTMTLLTPGTIAPDFTLPAADGRDVRLSEYRNQAKLVLVFLRAAG